MQKLKDAWETNLCLCRTRYAPANRSLYRKMLFSWCCIGTSTCKLTADSLQFDILQGLIFGLHLSFFANFKYLLHLWPLVYIYFFFPPERFGHLFTMKFRTFELSTNALFIFPKYTLNRCIFFINKSVSECVTCCETWQCSRKRFYCLI